MGTLVLVEDQYKVVAVKEGDNCPAAEFLRDRNPNYLASRAKLVEMLAYVAKNGLSEMPSGWSHEVDKRGGIYEFRKGDLRLFYFKGTNGEIAVCTGGIIKKTAKVDKSAVRTALKMKSQYEASRVEKSR